MLPEAVVMPAPQKYPAAALHDAAPEQLRVVSPVVSPAKDGAHKVQDAEPSLSVKVPSGHGTQVDWLDWPVALLNIPNGHSVQFDIPEAAL